MSRFRQLSHFLREFAAGGREVERRRQVREGIDKAFAVLVELDYIHHAREGLSVNITGDTENARRVDCRVSIHALPVRGATKEIRDRTMRAKR